EEEDRDFVFVEASRGIVRLVHERLARAARDARVLREIDRRAAERCLDAPRVALDVRDEHPEAAVVGPFAAVHLDRVVLAADRRSRLMTRASVDGVGRLIRERVAAGRSGDVRIVLALEGVARRSARERAADQGNACMMHAITCTWSTSNRATRAPPRS